MGGASHRARFRFIQHMHLHFAHHGLEFFFLTICVRGRRGVLLRLVEGKKRSVLSRARGDTDVTESAKPLKA